MTVADWCHVIDQAADRGVSDIQFIGGGPTLHPDLPTLVRRALARGVAVEIYTNLARVTPTLWDVFSLSGVRLATSYYSADAATHNAITGRRSHGRTLANIAEAARRGIPIRVGLVELGEDGHIGAAIADLQALGVENVRVDRLRQVGRGVRDHEPGVDQLCGRCADGSLAVLPTGEVLPCVFARWMVIGNAHQQSLADIDAGAGSVRKHLTAAFSGRVRGNDDQCDPDKDGGLCPPVCDPTLNCDPFKDK
jgi:MoaA/NifB/PqqE/SkfB family radical SAM enzyme